MFHSSEVTIKTVTFEKRWQVVYVFTNGEEWAGSHLNEYYKTHNYKTLFKPGTKLRLWTHQLSLVVGIEYWDPKKNAWDAIWIRGNKF